MNSIYLDNGSTTKPVDSIMEAIRPYIEEQWYNPSSLYSTSVKVRDAIETVRYQVAELINAEPNEIYFTSGATEANNWVIKGFIDSINGHSCIHGLIVTSPIEHNSILYSARIVNYLEKMRLDDMCANDSSCMYVTDVDKDGIVMLDSFLGPKCSIDNPLLVSIIAANNEIGTCQSLQSISKLVHNHKGIFHTDATQMLPHIPIDVKAMGIDLLSASAQKLGGLKGTGFLYINNDIKENIWSLIYGEQERGQRGGTENVVGIIALGEAIKHLNYKDVSHITATRDYFINSLERIGCKLIGSREYRLPNHISAMLPEGCGGEEMLYMLDTSGIYIGTGSACNSQSKDSSHVLKAIGLTDEEAARVIRITLSSTITVDDVDKTLREIKKNIELMTM